MLKRRYLALILVLVSLLAATSVYYTQQAKPSRKIYSGFWSRGFGALIPDSYVNLTKQMASIAQGLSPGNIWIVGRIEISKGLCGLSFPSNQTYAHMFFENRDINEDYLTAFDNNGIKIWLQVEPGFADIDRLIDLVLERYKSHPCVQGFAIDLEWRWIWPNKELVTVTDDEANHWLNKIKSLSPNYQLLLMHFAKRIMPLTARQDIVLIDDEQRFDGLNTLVNQFKSWGEHFSQSDVGYIFGFERDLKWLSDLENPPRDIASALIQNIPNCRYVFWCHETILEVFYHGE